MRTLSILIAVACATFGCGRSDPMKVTMVERDPQMQTAAVQARTQITNFLAALRSPAANQSNFVICVEFTSGGLPEPLWLGYIQYGENGFKGVVVTPPNPASGLTNGQPVQVAFSNVSDWAYVEDGKLVGGFTIRALRSKMSETDRRAYDAQFPYKIESRI